MKKSLEELAQTAKDAQRDYDTAVNEAKAKDEECEICKQCKDGEILTKATDKGFEYACKADANRIADAGIAHFKATLKSLEGEELHKVLFLASVGKLISELK